MFGKQKIGGALCHKIIKTGFKASIFAEFEPLLNITLQKLSAL
jgi:hypothetical protein